MAWVIYVLSLALMAGSGLSKVSLPPRSDPVVAAGTLPVAEGDAAIHEFLVTFSSAKAHSAANALAKRSRRLLVAPAPQHEEQGLLRLSASLKSHLPFRHSGDAVGRRRLKDLHLPSPCEAVPAPFTREEIAEQQFHEAVTMWFHSAAEAVGEALAAADANSSMPTAALSGMPTLHGADPPPCVRRGGSSWGRSSGIRALPPSRDSGGRRAAPLATYWVVFQGTTALADAVRSLPSVAGVARADSRVYVPTELRGTSARRGWRRQASAGGSITSRALSDILTRHSVWYGYDLYNLDHLDARLPSYDGNYDSLAAANGSNVDVYVVDTGINPNSTHFKPGQIAMEYGACTFAEGCDLVDCNGHGTHVAGTALSWEYGVAEGAELIPVRVFDCDGSTISTSVSSALEHIVNTATGSRAADRPGRRSVINMSLGAALSVFGPSAVDHLEEALLEQLDDLGIVTAVAAGNEDNSACTSSPAHIPAVVTVGASDRSDTLASFSNWGHCVDINAPGVHIVSAPYDEDTGFLILSGTSMATPFVAGVMARLLSQYPSMTSGELKAALGCLATPDRVSGVPHAESMSVAYSNGVVVTVNYSNVSMTHSSDMVHLPTALAEFSGSLSECSGRPCLPDGCANGGTCFNGECDCASGYWTRDCSGEALPLPPLSEVTDGLAAATSAGSLGVAQGNLSADTSASANATLVFNYNPTYGVARGYGGFLEALGDENAPEIVYRLELPLGARYLRFSTCHVDTGFDTQLSLWDSRPSWDWNVNDVIEFNDDSPDKCAGATGVTWKYQSDLVVGSVDGAASDGLAPGTYYLMLDGYQSESGVAGIYWEAQAALDELPFGNAEQHAVTERHVVFELDGDCEPLPNRHPHRNGHAHAERYAEQHRDAFDLCDPEPDPFRHTVAEPNRDSAADGYFN